MPNREKGVHQELVNRKICSYLPCQSVVRQWRDRKKRLHVPLFPGYVFVKLERHENYEVLNTPGVIRFVSFNRQLATISEDEINKIKTHRKW